MTFHCSCFGTLLLLAACLQSGARADAHADSSNQMEIQMSRLWKHILGNTRRAVPKTADELKDLLSNQMSDPQVQLMLQNPDLKQGLYHLIGDPALLDKLTTGHPELSKAMKQMLERDPTALNILLHGGQKASVEDLKNQFQQVAREDAQHIKSLTESAKLRDSLNTDIGTLLQITEFDTKFINSKIAVFKRGEVPELSDIEDYAEEQGDKDNKASLLSLQATQEPEDTSPIDLKRSVQTLARQMEHQLQALHTEDNDELKTLIRNARVRNALKMELENRIKEQQSALTKLTSVNSVAALSSLASVSPASFGVDSKGEVHPQ